MRRIVQKVYQLPLSVMMLAKANRYRLCPFCILSRFTLMYNHFRKLCAAITVCMNAEQILKVEM